MRDKIAESIVKYLTMPFGNGADKITSYNRWAKRYKKLLKDDSDRQYALRCFDTFWKKRDILKNFL